MRKTLLIIIFICLFSAAFGQKLAYRGKVLFIGDSAFFGQNMVNIFTKTAAQSGDSFQIQTLILIDSVTAAIAADSTLLNGLDKKPDFLFLQENVRRIITTEYHTFKNNLGTVKQFFRNGNTCFKPVFLQSWAFKNGESSLCPKYAMCCSYEAMVQSMIDYTPFITKGMYYYAPLAQAWQNCRQNYGGIDLYTANGENPSAYGAYLIANNLYDICKTLLDKNISTETYLAPGLDADTLEILRGISAEQVVGNENKWNNFTGIAGLEIRYELSGNGDYFKASPVDESGTPVAPAGVYLNWVISKAGVVEGQYNSTLEYYIDDTNTADYMICLTAFHADDTCNKITICKSLNSFFPYLHNKKFYKTPHYFYWDKNKNCSRETGEDTLFVPIVYENNSTSITNPTVNQFYEGKWKIKPQVKYLKPTCSNAELIVDSAHQYQVQAIPLTLTGNGIDLAADMLVGSAWNPGYTASISLFYANYGIKKQTAHLKLYKPDSVIFVAADVNPNTKNNNLIAWDIALKPGETGQMVVQFIPSYHTYSHTDTVHLKLLCDSISIDEDSSNNRKTLHIPTDGSFDPNYIEVHNPDALNTQKAAVYTIHFQNTGTAEARNIRIANPLQQTCPVKRISILGSSHPCTFKLDDGVLIFTFNDINLPDSGADYYGSQGKVSFSVELNGNCNDPGCDTITDQAAIYFDFNEPVITNEAQLTCLWPASTRNLYNIKSAFNLQPNPGNQNLTIIRSHILKTETYYIYDMQGRVICTAQIKAGEKQTTLSMPENCGSGLYIIKNNSGQSIKWQLIR